MLWAEYPRRRPFVTHINMRTAQDCFAYVDKLANFGTNYSPGKVYISPSAGGYGNTNYFFDDVRDPKFHGYTPVVEGSNGVVSFGASPAQISYVSCTDCTNYSVNLLNNTNVAGYMSWGRHGGWFGLGFTTNGWVKFHGSSSWSIVQIIESYNGQWVPIHDQTSFHDYFTGNSFWGTNYSNTPVGTVTHTDEPYFQGVADRFIYFGFWQGKKSFAICAWSARKAEEFQAVGDPFLIR
jgi:hypothetical protein